ncbi:AlpA family phage regulatory protein [Dyella terrae]|uniref:AlpA family phage regulatory protein n=3 Tax=Rhodanobacteraceae TaxID=1775411 RepID=A0A4R0Z2Z4_9GAMM|nr:AlpA family phage regulatory protein [Dyella terrae]TCI13858.1 AlpA family phage regulatory protein [Dyella soli]
MRARGILFSNDYKRKLEAKGKFPARVHLGHTSVAWVKSEVESYIADRIASRSVEVPA